MTNTVRITSGLYRGRAIKTPGGKTHPMGERERLALFNMISSYVPGAVVLDAFAGSGALGIEAISRGAESVVFVENNRDAVKMIKDNLVNLGIEAEVEVCKVSEFNSGSLFDLILADPPYDNFDLIEVEHLVQFLKQGGIFVLSHPGDAPEIQGLVLQKSRKYAGAMISIFVKS